MGIEGNDPSGDLVTMSRLPSPYVKHHNSMWAYGYHFTVDDEAGRQHVTFDAGVAAIISQTCRSFRADRHPIEAQLQYVGIVKDILRVDYVHLKFNVLRCFWIKLDLAVEPTIRQDQDGFWLVKHRARQSPEIEPYLMPSHARQVLVVVPRFLFYSHTLILYFVVSCYDAEISKRGYEAATVVSSKLGHEIRPFGCAGVFC